MEQLTDIFNKLYQMTAFSNIIADPSFLIMYALAFVLLYLGIVKKYEPLLLVPIAFGVLLANFHPLRDGGHTSGLARDGHAGQRQQSQHLGNAVARHRP